MRGLLAPLAALAAEHGAAVVAVTHLPKAGRGQGGSAVYRAMGSLAFTAAARVVLAVSKDPDDPARRLVLPVKNNLTPDPTGLAYRVEPDRMTGAAQVRWEEDPVALHADDVLGGGPGGDRPAPAREGAAAFLTGLLADGPRPAAEVTAAATAAGITPTALRKARRALCESRQEGFGEDQRRVWALRAEGG